MLNSIRCHCKGWVKRIVPLFLTMSKVRGISSTNFKAKCNPGHCLLTNNSTAWRQLTLSSFRLLFESKRFLFLSEGLLLDLGWCCGRAWPPSLLRVRAVDRCSLWWEDPVVWWRLRARIRFEHVIGLRHRITHTPKQLRNNDRMFCSRFWY